MATRLKPVSFDQINGWPSDDHLAAMEVFLKSARHMQKTPYKTRGLKCSSAQLTDIATLATGSAPFSNKSARQFFETHFQPCNIVDGVNDLVEYSGFVTAYYEPEVEASRVRTAQFQTPLYARPGDLVDVTDNNRPNGWDPDFRFARLDQQTGKIYKYPDRKAIGKGYLEGRGLEIAWVRDSVEALFIHIQGSARLRFDDGSVIRVGFAAKSGHPYTAVGKVLLDRGDLVRENSGMQAIRDWFAKNPDQTKSVIDQNCSFIFFSEYPVENDTDGPVGAAKVNLTPGRSLAVDRTLHTFGLPVWIETKNPVPGSKHPFRQLMMAQDTGSAIVGPRRGDLFLGSGEKAGKIAGDVRHDAKFVVFVPKNHFFDYS